MLKKYITNILKKINHLNQKIAKKLNKYIKKIDKIPSIGRIISGIILILFGIVSLVNPFINGIFIIFVGIRFLSKNFYKKALNFIFRRKIILRKHKRKYTHELIDILEKK